MDSVRFGRALGFGARHAARALVSAVDAATAENPSRKAVPPAATRTASASSAQPGAAASVPPARTTQQGLREGSRRFGQAVWNPFVRVSNVLWLEVTGFVFGMIATFAGLGAWKARASWDTGPHAPLFAASAMAVVFAWFSISSFVRAHRRQRRP